MNRVLNSALFLIIFQQSIIGQGLDQTQKEFIEKNATSILVDSKYRGGSWEPVLEVVKDKKLVLLGEFNHGSK